MSAPAACTAAMLTTVHEDHGHKWPHLSRVGAAVFIAARECADPETAIVADRLEVGARIGLPERTLRRWLGYLEHQRWQQRVLVQRRGARELWVLLADIPGIPSRRRPQVAVDDEQGDEKPEALERDTLGRKTGPREWRLARAQLGGVKRAMAEAVRKRHEAEAELERVTARLYADRQAEAQLGVSGEVAALLHDLGHAVECANPSCQRCAAIAGRLGAARQRYATAVEVGTTVDRAMRVTRAGAELLAAMRDQSVGAAMRRAEARKAFAAVLEDS